MHFCERGQQAQGLEQVPDGDRILKSYFTSVGSHDDRGVSETRGLACELVAWRFVTRVSERDAIDLLCSDLLVPSGICNGPRDNQPVHDEENSPLLGEVDEADEADDSDQGTEHGESGGASGPGSTIAEYHGMTALEVAAVVGAKKFLSQRAVQRIIDGIWKGQIVFWTTMSAHSSKEATAYNPGSTDPFCRLRVPLYLRVFEVAYFAILLALYYTVLVQKSSKIGAPEIMLYIWLASFAYNGTRASTVYHVETNVGQSWENCTMLGLDYTPLTSGRFGTWASS